MLKTIIPVLLLVAAYFLGKYLIATGPEPKKKPSSERIPVVELMPIKRENYTVELNASGIVKAGIQTNLVAEVSGRVVKIPDNFQEGAYFDKGQILLEIDKENYQNAVAIAEGEVAVNKANLQQIKEEESSNQRSIQLARENLALGKKEVVRLRGLWKRKLIAQSVLDAEEQKTNQLQQKLQDLQGKQNTYASQRLATEAKINSATAKLKQEKLNLSRTTIRAPYAGRVLKKNVDVGQFVSTGTALGQIYATDYVNVELPLSLGQYELLDMPGSSNRASSPGTRQSQKRTFPDVILSAPDRFRKARWKGKVVRSSAALDAESRQITVIVRIDHPFDPGAAGNVPVRIGQYLNARIKGKTFKDVLVLPAVAIRHNQEILLYQYGKIAIVPVDVLWNAKDKTVLKTHHEVAGKQLIITPMSQAFEGMNVVSLEEQRDKLKKAADRKAPKNKKQPDKNNIDNGNAQETSIMNRPDTHAVAA